MIMKDSRATRRHQNVSSYTLVYPRSLLRCLRAAIASMMEIVDILLRVSPKSRTRNDVSKIKLLQGGA
jgi:hypothetical protein